MEDNKIIALFFARSEEAIAALDHKYGRLCRSVSYNILHDRQDAEKVTEAECEAIAASLRFLA